ncbi:MAG TPA: molecular chaperone DnaJ [Cyanobacteria bacterium UBA8156]|jgi:molecular chaperone DnaJ|nr:molecular chaperone DnaJ [Cyanobacteria bacterium UBA8156]
MSDLYQILQIDRHADGAAIKKAYRRLVKQYHPDRHPDGHEPMARINAAYEVLSDPDRRAAYDRRHAPRRVAVVSRPAANPDLTFELWREQVYVPVLSILEQGIAALSQQIDDLAADPFDDVLMAAFMDYVADCRQQCQRARECFRSRPNPPQSARSAEYLFYALNHFGDGLDELEFFTQNFNEASLHAGAELWRIAQEMCDRAAAAFPQWPPY